MLVLVTGWGRDLLVTRFDPTLFRQSVQSAPFTVSDAGKLLQLKMHAPLSNAWAAYDVQVHRGDKQIFSMAKEISYYHGVSGGESWSEGSQSASAYFKVPEPGEYKLVVKGEGGIGNRGTHPPNTGLSVTVIEGVIVSRYFIVLFIAAGLAFLFQYFAKWRFEAKRWADTDDDD